MYAFQTVFRLLTRRPISNCMYSLVLAPANTIFVSRIFEQYHMGFDQAPFQATLTTSTLRPACEANRTTVHETQPVLGLDVMVGGIDYPPKST